jgi:hypothetical protein
MNQRSLGILGAALVVGGIALGIASGIADRQVAGRNLPATGVHRPDQGNFPRQRGQGQQPGPAFGRPGQGGFPGFGNRPPPNTTNPRPSPSG